MVHTAQKERETVRDEMTAATIQARVPVEGSLADIAPAEEAYVKKDEKSVSRANQVPKMKIRKEFQRGLAASAYLHILFVVPLLFPVKDEFVDFHLRQGIVLFAIGALVSFVAWSSFLAWLVTGGTIASLAVFAAVQAAQGRKWKIPIIGTVAQKIALE